MRSKLYRRDNLYRFNSSMWILLTLRAEGLLQSLKHGLQSLDVHDLSGAACKKLVGIRTDGASTNIAA